jgi:hypothetical protein
MTARPPKGEPIRYMPIDEFRAHGYLQELNRQFLHPLGLALEVRRDEDTGIEVLGGIWDYRDDPEGMRYAPGVMDVDKADQIALEHAERIDARMGALGYWIQQLDDQPASELEGDPPA